MLQKYLDYDSLAYYHQKLKIKLSAIALSEEDINDICKNSLKTPIDKSLSIASNNYFRIKLAGTYANSGYDVITPVEWEVSNLTFHSNTEYGYNSVLSTKNKYVYEYYPGLYEYATATDLDGLSIELLGRDEDNNLLYYSTIGNYYTNFEKSNYSMWDGAKVESNNETEILDESEFWNFIYFSIPVGEYQTFTLNYFTDETNISNNEPTDKKLGTYFDSDDFQVTIMHTAYNYYSVIFYWECYE